MLFKNRHTHRTVSTWVRMILCFLFLAGASLFNTSCLADEPAVVTVKHAFFAKTVQTKTPSDTPAPQADESPINPRLFQSPSNNSSDTSRATSPHRLTDKKRNRY
ncbi:MAG: hypothetical protein JW795_11365 [Chitinivibrionales bacterium]|nr:hypothetical protein [Chitinivibrionales bacterium]